MNLSQNRNRLTDTDITFVDGKGEKGRKRDGLGVWSWKRQTIPFRIDKQ